MMYLGENPIGLATIINGSPWKIKNVTATSAPERADAVAAWIASILPTNTIALIIRDDYESNPRTTGTLKIAKFNGTTPISYIRNRNGVEAFSGENTGWSSSYDLGFNIGDTYTILYKQRR